jgi:hypothetical protein
MAFVVANFCPWSSWNLSDLDRRRSSSEKLNDHRPSSQILMSSPPSRAQDLLMKIG